ncbi:MAG: acyl-ACP thioesterase domain-containing protein [Bacteroidales bacterium]
MISYRENLRVKSYETDINANLKIYSFMNYAQEIAGLHADSLGFGYDSLIKESVVWVLSRIHVKFIRLPKWGDDISVETWHKGSDRLFGFRDFEVLDNSGEQMILATSSWLIINTTSRRLQRLDNIMGEGSLGYNPRNAIKEAAERLVSPAEMEYTGKRVVAFSDVDINRHTNNAKYIEWALDWIDKDLVTKMKVTDMFINFNAESRLGEEVEFYRAMEVGNGNCGDDRGKCSVFIEGKRETTSIFQAKLKYTT